ncbi:hypothetical protein [Krasilnikovia sp. M28-CT-15]|uniref:hypothetical protein n=1 Tax=Krasilnikovia sp. M28-CT-15 TaxID=3373540 RepID=UPI0038765F4F
MAGATGLAAGAVRLAATGTQMAASGATQAYGHLSGLGQGAAPGVHDGDGQQH